ncbi:Fc.00g056160.m01.CDS01 [Cosmosporella sp. VM-42]
MPLDSMEAASLDSLYDGPEAQAIFSRSVSTWRSVLKRARLLHTIPKTSLDLSRCLDRVPSLPDAIPRDARWIEGCSTWSNSDPLCPLKTKTETSRRIFLTKRHHTRLSVSSSLDFRYWGQDANNGIALLTLGWSYTLSAALAERQSLSMVYCPATPSLSCPSATLDLHYASPQERRWWKAIVARGIGWSISDERTSPWAIEVGDIGFEILDCVESNEGPPTAREAACYLSRLCNAYGLGSQSSAALAAALTIPLHASATSPRPAEIKLPKPAFTTHPICSDSTSISTDFNLIGYLMTLSLCPWAMGPALWSVFWDPDVPCNFAGAWLLPIAAALQPIISNDCLERLAKVLSFTAVAPLWLGLAICGRQPVINSIYPSLAKLQDYPFFRPNVDAAAWTGVAQSFIDCHQTRPCHDGTISRADVWRLRHDCSATYPDEGFSHTPPHGWPPFGRMRAQDVELEIRHHLNCSHHWNYSHWTWSWSGMLDDGFSADTRHSCQLPKATVFSPVQLGYFEIKGREDIRKISETATKAVFWWCCTQVEKGFSETIVPRRSAPDEPLKDNEGPELKDPELIKVWLETITS